MSSNDLPAWLWFLMGCIVGIPSIAYLNCYIERWRERVARVDEDRTTEDGGGHEGDGNAD